MNNLYLLSQKVNLGYDTYDCFVVCAPSEEAHLTEVCNNLYLISQDERRGYDTYSSAVVCAPSEESARGIHPDGDQREWTDIFPTWASSPSKVQATLIGRAEKNCEVGVVVASFHAG